MWGAGNKQELQEAMEVTEDFQLRSFFTKKHQAFLTILQHIFIHIFKNPLSTKRFSASEEAT
jgi:hypothetical protein